LRDEKEEVTLVPLGCARFRISRFPTLSETPKPAFGKGIILYGFKLINIKVKS